jgi:hypothetical protein
LFDVGRASESCSQLFINVRTACFGTLSKIAHQKPRTAKIANKSFIRHNRFIAHIYPLYIVAITDTISSELFKRLEKASNFLLSSRFSQNSSVDMKLSLLEGKL